MFRINPSRLLLLLLLMVVWTLSACIPVQNPDLITPVAPTTTSSAPPAATDEPPETADVHPLDRFAPQISALLTGDASVIAEHIHFTTMPCTHRTGLGGPPKCEDGENEGDPVDVFPILGPSGTYLRRGQIDTLILHAASVSAIHRVTTGSPGDGWPPGEYGIVVLNADPVPPAITVYLTDGKIVRATYHMGKFPEQVLEEIADEILYLAD